MLFRNMASTIAAWHRVLRYGAVTLGVVHGNYAFGKLSEIRATERKQEIGMYKAILLRSKAFSRISPKILSRQ